MAMLELQRGRRSGNPVAEFHPTVETTFAVWGSLFRFMPHPWYSDEPDDVFAMEGGEAQIYQVREVATGALAALKVTKPLFRGEHIARSVAALLPYVSLPGLAAANRICLTRADYPALIASFPDLEYAILMPWIEGRSWAGLILDPALSDAYTEEHALSLARATAQILWNLEAHHLAHTDVAGGNVVLRPDFKGIELLDIENLYIPGVPAPRHWSRGSPGYQHPQARQRGQWLPEGDRFAGAILLVEMLAWADPRVRDLTPSGAETLFQPEELQQVGAARWQATRDALWALCPPTLRLFDQVWSAPTLAECPELGEWALALLDAEV